MLLLYERLHTKYDNIQSLQSGLYITGEDVKPTIPSPSAELYKVQLLRRQLKIVKTNFLDLFLTFECRAALGFPDGWL